MNTAKETLDQMRRSVETLVQEENTVLGRLAAFGKNTLWPEGVISFNEDWRVIWADDVMHRFAGYESGELVGMSLSDLLGSQYKDAWLGMMRAHQTSGRISSRWDSPLTFQLKMKTGEERPMFVRVSLQAVLGKRVFVLHMRNQGSVADVT